MEPCFPRGGVVRAEAPNTRSKKEYYGATNKQKDVKANPSKRMREKDAKKTRDAPKEDNENNVQSANTLSLTALTQGMLLMGYVKSVHTLHILVCLPGRLVGKLPITNISKSYTDLLQTIVDNEDLTTKSKPLVDMFPIGQLLYVRVIEKCQGDREEIILSVMPQDIHSEIGVSMLEEGHAMMCAVQTSEDHGYLMETGIKGVQAFLPKKNIKTEPTVGEMVFCHITKVIAGTITLNSFRKNELQKIETADVPNLKTLLPGLVVNFTIVRVLKNGVEGLLFDGSISAFVNEFHFSKHINISDSAIIGKEVKARILYTMPLSNQIFVTLNVNEVKTTDLIKFGTVIQDAKVIRQTSNGILMKLNAAGNKGLIPRKTLVKNLKNNFDIDSTLIKFAPNSVHAIRVMDYSQMENIYVCSNDKNFVNETYFSTADLKIAQLISVNVVQKLENGFEVKIGQVRGYLKGILWHEKSKVSVGDSLKVRVVEIDTELKAIQVTNLPGFLKDGTNFLWNVKHTIGTFSGVVFKETKNSFLVLFFNHLKGIFPKTPENVQKLEKIGGLKVGVVRGFQIKSANKEKIYLHLPKPQESDNLGKVFECKVTSIFPTAVQVHINDLKCFGKVPVNFLSEFPSLTNPIYSSLKEGDTMKVVALTNNNYSRRDVEYYQSGPVIDFQDVKPGDTLRCFVKNFTDRMVELTCPLKNFTEVIKLGVSCFENADDRIFQLDEIVYVNVIGKNEGIKKSLYVTPNLSKVWKNDMDASVKIVDNYLKDIDYLLQKMKKNGKPLGQYKVGQRVSGKVNSVLSNKLLVELPNGVFGQIPIKDMNNYKLGNEIKSAVVVFIDPAQQILHLSIDTKIMSEIGETQTVPKGFNSNKKYKTIIVYSNEHIKVCTIRQPNQPLVYVPARFHYNDYTPVVKPDYKNATSKLMVKQVTNKVIGIFVHDFKIGQKLEKYKTKLISSVLKRKGEKVDEQENKRVKRDCQTEDSEEEINVTQQIADSDVEETLEEPTTINGSSEKIQRNVLKRLSNVGNKGKKLGRNVSESFKKKTKTLTKKRGSKNLTTQNKDSMLEGSLVNLVSFKKIKEDQKETEKSPIKNKPKSFTKMSNQKSPKRLKNKKLVYKTGN